MAKKRKTKSKARKSAVSLAEQRRKLAELKRKKDEETALKLPHGVITGAYGQVVEQMHPDGYDEEKVAKRGRKTKRKVAKKKAAKRKVAKKKAAPKRKVRRKK
jgi:adenylate kinase